MNNSHETSFFTTHIFYITYSLEFLNIIVVTSGIQFSTVATPLDTIMEAPTVCLEFIKKKLP